MSLFYTLLTLTVLLFFLNRIIIIYMKKGYRKYLAIPSLVFLLIYLVFWFFRLSDFVKAENAKQLRVLDKKVVPEATGKKKKTQSFYDMKDYEVKDPLIYNRDIKSNSTKHIFWLYVSSIQLVLALYFAKRGSEKYKSKSSEFKMPAVVYLSLFLLNSIMICIYHFLET
ncbi:MAG: hypothetical protein EBZ47_10240 [Chlamydiae bacterium]|nr:hypothetical protein [Chlamydiota bacterium]